MVIFFGDVYVRQVTFAEAGRIGGVVMVDSGKYEGVRNCRGRIVNEVKCNICTSVPRYSNDKMLLGCMKHE